MPDSALAHLECPECGKKYDADRVQSFCEDCRSPLVAHYDLNKVAASVTPVLVSARPEGAAALAGLRNLGRIGWVQPDEMLYYLTHDPD